MIQIDMPMPTCCDECFALDDHGDYPFCLISQDQRGYTFNTRKNRMPTCPLKAQEPRIEPIQDMVGDALFWVCGKCGCDIKSSDRYCSNCGKAVKWE